MSLLYMNICVCVYRYDMVCPAISAHDLKQVFPEAELHYTLTGHSGFEKEIIEKLVDATDRFKNR